MAFCSLCVRFFLATLVCSALSAKVKAALLDNKPSARSTALGSAYTALASGSEALYWNPAGLCPLNARELSLTMAQPYSALNIQSNQINAATGFKNTTALGIGFSQWRIGNLYREETIILGAGLTLKKLPLIKSSWKVSAGLNIKIFRRAYSPDSDALAAESDSNGKLPSDYPLAHNYVSNASFDLGARAACGPNILVGLMVQDILEPNVGFYQNEALRRGYRLGAAYQLHHWSIIEKINFNFDLSVRSNAKPQPYAGIEAWLPGQKIALRAGANNGEINSGFAAHKIFGRALLRIDYAYLNRLHQESTPWGAHRITLTIRFENQGQINERTK